MNKTLIITGASGYVAGALRSCMKNGEYRLKLVSRKGGEGAACDHEELCESRLDSVSAWGELIEDADFVIHLSALTNLAVSEGDIELSRRENVAPVAYLLEAVKKMGRRDLGVIFASTTTVIGIGHPIPVNEDMLEVPISNYDRHKLEVEHLLKEAVDAGVVKACSLRFANVYGVMGANASRNKNRGIVNMMLGRALNQQDLTVFGDGSNIRDFVHIKDVVGAIMRVVETPEALNGGSYIVASEVGTTLKQAFQVIANEVNKLFAYDVAVTSVAQPSDLHPIETRNFIGDCTKLKKATGWHPNITFEQGIRQDILALSEDSENNA